MDERILIRINKDLKIIKKQLRKVDVPNKAIQSIGTRALRSGRRLTGEFRSNRNSRWLLSYNDPQYGTEIHCKLIFIKLLGRLMQFDRAPITTDTIKCFGVYLNFETLPYKDPLTKEVLSYEQFIDETINPKHGHSSFHMGHLNPQLQPKHLFKNVDWMTKRSNLIQGDMTIKEASDKLLKIGSAIIRERKVERKNEGILA